MFDSSGLELQINNNWLTHPRASEIPTALAPVEALEAAMVMTLTPGAYTAIVRGTAEGPGVAIIEVFDFDGGPGMTNLSTRGFVGKGDNVLICGLIINGSTPKTVVIRGRGPSLADFGVPDTLHDPELSVFAGNEQIDFNDDFARHPRESEMPSTLIPTHTTESAILITLEPGAYTAILRGKAQAEGIGIVEVFEVSGSR